MKADNKQLEKASKQRVIAITKVMVKASQAECKRLGSNSAEVAEAADHVASITSTTLIEHIAKKIGKEKAMYMAHLFANIYRDRAAEFIQIYAKYHKEIEQKAKEKK